MKMKPFLTHIIDKINADASVPMYEVAVILPNRRARRYLLQGLLPQNSDKPHFVPQIFPMEEFVAWLSPLKVVDPVTLLLRLHELVRGYGGDRFGMHRMLSWGTAFLKDISDMDMQLQDVPAILREYANAAQFEVSFGKEELSETDREKLMFNELLADLYVQYGDLLRHHAEAYEGMLYRDCVEHIADYAGRLPFKRLIFAGFYALSPAELRIIRYLKTHFRTEIYFDVDPFYCHIEEPSTTYARREPAFFIQRDCRQLEIAPSELEFFENNYVSIPKKVKIVSTSKNMRQIYGAIREVERIREEKCGEWEMPNGPSDKKSFVNMSDTAVVLADENLLFPFLISYQSDTVNVNATMGFPFEATPVSTLLQQVVAVYESAFAITPDGASELSFSGEQLQLFWDHELMIFQDDRPGYFPTVINYSQLSHNELFMNIPKTELGSRLPAVLQAFCNYAEEVSTVEVYRQLWREASRKMDEVQTLFASHFAQDEPVDFPFAKYAVMRMLGDISVSMEGDHDSGLQVMGLLETRMMDFKNVIMLSVNEGILPKGITYNSLLPFDFKFKFDGEEALPNYLYQDQVYAYHFFRLLQRAENVTLIYNKASDVNLAEKSRFISQLEYEVKVQSLEDRIEIQHEDLDFDLELPVRAPVSMPKTPSVMDILRKYVFSASSLQTYISCPLRFYFQHLMKIREPEVLTDNLEVYELGTVTHAVYKQAFDAIAKEDDPNRYNSILQHYIDNSDQIICDEIRKLSGRSKLTSHDLDSGAWLINRRILGETVRQYLETAKGELKQSSWRIVANEMPVNISDYPVVPLDGGPRFGVHLTGSLDRVQCDGDRVMILDYKTGVVEPGELAIKVKKDEENNPVVIGAALDSLFSDTKYAKLFQLVMYMLMYEHVVTVASSSIQVGIISTREINKKSPDYILPGSVLKETNILIYEKQLQERLNRLFCEIFNPEMPFEQTQDEKRCRNCDFQRLCGRQTSADSR